MLDSEEPDYSIIAPRLADIYAWSAVELDEPELLGLVHEGVPAYAVDVSADYWVPRRHQTVVRAIRRLIP